MLALDGGQDVADRETPGAHLLAAQPQPNGALALAEQRHGRDPGNGLEPGLDLAPDVLAGIDHGAVRVHRHPQDRVVAEVLLDDHRRLHVLGELVPRHGDLVPDVLGSRIDLPAELELDGDERRAVHRRAPEGAHARDRVQVLFEDVGHVLFDHLRAGAFEPGRHRDDGKVHVRKLVDAQTVVSEQAEDDQRQRQHQREDRPPDEEVDRAHHAPSRASASSELGTSTGLPSGFLGDTRSPSTSAL
jgi:hypothetical protein